MPSVPGVQQRLPSLRAEPIAFAHRGARAHARENTLEAFSLALAMGATGLESDVWSTADGRAVLDHDGVVRGRVRSRPVSSVPFDNLPTHMPAFEDIVNANGTSFEFSIDIKSPGAVEALARAVEKSGFPAVRLWLCSPAIEVLAECRLCIPGANLVHSTRSARLDGTLEQHLARIPGLGIRALNMHHTEWNGGRVALAHPFDVCAFGWDLQHEEEMRTGVRMGLDAVYSDHVDMMMRIVAEESATPRG